MTPRPMQQIDEIIKLTRQYVGAVVRANVPSQYVPGAELDSKLWKLLQPHREANRQPGSDLMILKNKLCALNCDFVLGGEIAWRLDVLEWEKKIWGPIQCWVDRGYAMLFEHRPGGIWPSPVPERDLRDWQQDEEEIELLLKDRKIIFCPDDYFPKIDEEHHSVRWKEVSYHIGNNNQFRLFVLLLKNHRRKVTYSEVGPKIRKNCSEMSDEAIHQTVCRLKQRLPLDLATCIINGDRLIQLVLPPFPFE